MIARIITRARFKYKLGVQRDDAKTIVSA
jgi:hypothetical protein